MKTTGLHHICIRVQDQELSRRWYENVLGFECVELNRQGTRLPLGAASLFPERVVMMRAGDTYITLQPPLEGTSPG